MDKPIVTVHGEARREIPPEQAVFSITVSSSDRDKAALVARITRRAAEIDAVLDRRGPAVERRETAGIHMSPEYNRRGKRAETYAGSITTTVTVIDFDPLGELLAELAAGELTSISGPWWQLRPGSRADAGVRGEAVTDALDRARVYAAAVGAELDRIVEIADAEAAPAYELLRGAVAESDEAGAAFDLYPRQQTVEARVLLRVSITEPTVLRG
ncbi:SIMPL domain-containing protein [Actinoplanes aureus]|uniref:SIMPL domain-containing protein n=1 Tax=Actinoplanes aureus TaxID=2792083 RepID=A0A931C917_9ACTN|nr:SIMPL domain-containing protein [Actinoplanes aureus]MBG0561723.1 SIMPL domain-containing protein [Actinoplanes aureus]